MAKTSSESLLWWILVIPAACAAYLASQFIIGSLYIWYTKVAKDDADVLIVTVGLPIIRGVVGGFAFIWSGVYLAPSKKKETAIVLLVLLGITATALALSSYIGGQKARIFEYLSAIVGAAVYVIRNNRK